MISRKEAQIIVQVLFFFKEIERYTGLLFRHMI